MIVVVLLSLPFQSQSVLPGLAWTSSSSARGLSRSGLLDPHCFSALARSSPARLQRMPLPLLVLFEAPELAVIEGLECVIRPPDHPQAEVRENVAALSRLHGPLVQL